MRHLSRITLRATLIQSAFWALLFTTLSGCAQLGVPQAKSFEERLAWGYSMVTAVREATFYIYQAELDTAGADADRIDAVTQDAIDMQKRADTLRQALDAARILKGTDFETADVRLESTLAALEALRNYLETRR